MTELGVAIGQIIALEESADLEQEANDENREEQEPDRKNAEDVRKKAMKTIGKTQKRNFEEGSKKEAKKSQGSGSGAVEHLKE